MQGRTIMKLQDTPETQIVPASTCKGCGRHNDRATFAGETKNDMPKAGQLSICFKCGHLAMFAEDLTLRDLNDEEMHAVAGDPFILEAQRLRKLAYEAMMREKEGKP
jgi:hypothetical protein